MKSKMNKIRMKIKFHQTEIALVTIGSLLFMLGTTKIKLDKEREDFKNFAMAVIDLNLHEQIIEHLENINAA